MKYETKTVTITEEDVRTWIRAFEKREADSVSVVPGLCVWSYAHQDDTGWLAAKIDIKFSKPVYVGETITISGTIEKERSCYCHRKLTITVNEEVRQEANLKCILLS